MDAERLQAVGPHVRAELARRRLLDFLATVVANYQRSAHVALIAEHLEAVERGEIRRLVVTAPPRHSKSLTVAQGFAAWYVGRNPERAVVVASYGAELAEGHSRRARGFLLRPSWPFPGVAVSAESAAVGRWNTTSGGGMRAVGVGGAITGFGADVLILDDLIRGRADADSQAIRDSTDRWLREDALTRLQPGGAVVAVGTRWHEDDPLGRILAGPGADEWTVLNLPALAEENDPLGRDEGEALWPDWFPVERLLELREELGSRGFAALYQGAPTPAEGATFKRDWLAGTYPRPPETGLTIVTGCDASFGKGTGSDYSALVTIAGDGTYFYVLDATRGRWEFSDLVAAIKRSAETWGPTAVLVEDSAAGQSAIQELRRSTDLPIVAVKPEGSKTARADAVTPLFEAGRVLFPEASPPWRDDLLEELASFPAGKHDDQVDAVVYALERLRGGSGGHGGVAGSVNHARTARTPDEAATIAADRQRAKDRRVLASRKAERARRAAAWIDPRLNDD